jgi:hypothetical protein
MRGEQRHISPTTTAPCIVPLDLAQRRKLLVRACGWLGLGGIPIVVCCIYGPLAINWLVPATASLLVAVLSGVFIALVDSALMSVLIFGLTLLHEGIIGTAVQTTEIVHTPAWSMLTTHLGVRAERAGCLRAATPTLVRTIQSGKLHIITYSPRARMLWACSVIDQTEASRA